MTFHMAFLASPQLSLLSRPRTLSTGTPISQRRHHHVTPKIATKMTYAATVAAELVTISVLSVASFYAFNRFKSEDNPKTEKTLATDPAFPEETSDGPSSTKEAPMAPVTLMAEPEQLVFSGIYPQYPTDGLSFTGSQYPQRSSPTVSPRQQGIPQSWENISVGALPSAPPFVPPSAEITTIPSKLTPIEMTRQLQWAVDQLNDLDDCAVAAIIDTNDYLNAIVASSGDISMLKLDQVPVVDELTVRNVSEWELEYGTSSVKSIACVPVGDTKLTVIMMSEIQDFLGPKGTRIVNIVCEKLVNIAS